MNEIIDHSGGVYELAERCEVPIGAACRRAHISPASPPRWRRGTRPRPQQLHRLRRVIMEMAREQGTVPPNTDAHPAITEPELRAGLATIERAAAALLAKLDAAA